MSNLGSGMQGLGSLQKQTLELTMQTSKQINLNNVNKLKDGIQDGILEGVDKVKDVVEEGVEVVKEAVEEGVEVVKDLIGLNKAKNHDS